MAMQITKNSFLLLHVHVTEFLATKIRIHRGIYYFKKPFNIWLRDKLYQNVKLHGQFIIGEKNGFSNNISVNLFLQNDSKTLYNTICFFLFTKRAVSIQLQSYTVDRGGSRQSVVNR